MTLCLARDVRSVNMSAAVEGDVCRPAGEAQLLVQGDGRAVLLVDVEHGLVEATPPEVPEAGQRQRPAQPEPLRRRVHAEHVDLADRIVIVARVAVHLRPVETEQLATAPGEEAVPMFLLAFRPEGTGPAEPRRC